MVYLYYGNRLYAYDPQTVDPIRLAGLLALIGNSGIAPVTVGGRGTGDERIVDADLPE